MARVNLRGKAVLFKGFLGTPAERRADLRAAGVEVAVRISNRTTSHRDEDNRAFRPYSPAYAEWKGVAPTAVDLFLSGDMLKALDVVEVTDSTCRVGFTDDAMRERAAHNEQRGRRFLGVPAAWLDDIKRYYLVKRIAQGR